METVHMMHGVYYRWIDVLRGRTPLFVLCWSQTLRFKREFALNKHLPLMLKTRHPHADVMRLKQNETQIQ